ncbi:hypothetical protein BH11VER1_BH11VER1_23090 [soil metagenome]
MKKASSSLSSKAKALSVTNVNQRVETIEFDGFANPWSVEVYLQWDWDKKKEELSAHRAPVFQNQKGSSSGSYGNTDFSIKLGAVRDDSFVETITGNAGSDNLYVWNLIYYAEATITRKRKTGGNTVLETKKVEMNERGVPFKKPVKK